MKFAAWLLILAFLASAMGAAVVQPPPYNPCPTGFTLSSTDLPTRDAAIFVTNILHYNKNNLMSGTPQGPWFDIDTSAPCTWIPNGAFSCQLLVYSSAAKTLQIGSATLSSSDLELLNDAYNSSGGYMTYTQTINSSLASFPSSADYQNFRSLSAQLYFQIEPVYPTTNPIANRLENIGGNLYLTLWGSTGYDAASQQFLPAGQGTGMDLRLQAMCPNNPPPIIPGCPCDDPAAIFSVARSSIVRGQPISRSGANCVQLSFSDS